MSHTAPLASLQQALAMHGLLLRGGFAPSAADGLPPLPSGQAAASLWLVGVVGSAFWPHFKASEFFGDGQSDPLDRWSRSVGDALAQRLGGVALYPFDGPPYHPFQRWADRAEPTQPSPMMLRIHPAHGLWHAYRFALALPLPAPASVPLLPPAATAPDLCAACSGRPCLGACPVGAYDGSGFALERCASHLHSGAGSACLQGGCLARRACPVAPAQRYIPEHAAFHMHAFIARH